jgi:glycosyltransferase involved in cell wall biosynthesis
LRARFHREAEEIGLGEVVRCTGWLDKPRDLLAGMDLYLHPAAYEGLPLAILEAMAAGLPCVLSPEIAAEMRAFDERTVILSHDGTDDWVDLASDADARLRYSEASRRLHQEYFRPEAMARAFQNIYQEKLR